MRAFRFMVTWLTPRWVDRILARRLAQRRARLLAEQAELQALLDDLRRTA